MTLSEQQRKPAFPAPIPNRSDTEKTEDGASRGPLCETAGLGAFSRQIQAKTKRARRITRQALFLSHPHRPNGTAARSASTNCASAGLAVSCRQTAMTSSFSSAPVSGMNTRFSAGEYLRAE